MIKNKTSFKITACLLSLLFITVMTQSVFAQTEAGAIELEIKYNNGDSPDFNEIKVLVYQNLEKIPFIEKNLTSNPEKIEGLTLDKKYRVKIFVNDILADTRHVNLQTPIQTVESIIPLSGGLKISTFFKDGHIPIKNAKVIIKSQDGNILREGKTNKDGSTLRYWLQSTLQTMQQTSKDYYYDAEVYIDNIQVASSKKINLKAGLQTNHKIIATIPSVLEEKITITVYKNDYQKVKKIDGAFKVDLYDSSGIKAYQSPVGVRGEAYFSNIRPGEYQVTVQKSTEISNEPAKIAITGQEKNFNVFLNESKVHQYADDALSNTSCNCVAFRLDDVQDYWLNDVQSKIIGMFTDRELPLTVGIIGDSFGEDQKIVTFIKEQNTLEIANHGIGNEPFTSFTKKEQSQRISQSNEHIVSTLGVKPTVFIPPQNRFNDDTITALKENEMTHISSSLTFDPDQIFSSQDSELYRFPEITTTGQYDTDSGFFVGVKGNATFAQLRDGIEKHGFAVVTMHPQEFSKIEDGIYVNKINTEQVIELNELIDNVMSSNLKIVPISKINQTTLEKNIPEWVKNNAKWWTDDAINDDTFVASIEFLIKNEIINMQNMQFSENDNLGEIPSWIKDNTREWSQGLISEKEFLDLIKYLIASKIIII